jgi:uracil-xanthine permease
MSYLSGGVVCAEEVWKINAQVVDSVGYGMPVSDVPSAVCLNGDVALNYGSPEYIGLGFSVIVMLVLIEMFGSAFMKNCNVIIGLLFGFFVAGVSSYKKDGETYLYVTNDKLQDAPWITFLWVETFKLGFYAPAVLPTLVAYLVTTIETIGDIGATFEASELPLGTPEHDQSIQGGLLADGLSSFFSCLGTSMPNTTFSENNGVITMTKCASRHAGIACGCWLVFFGVMGKFAGMITTIPDCVIGGMTIFLFTQVFVSGVVIISKVDLTSRRNRFIVGMSMALGLGVLVFPYAFLDQRASPYTAGFWPCGECSDTVKGVRNAVMIFFSTGYCVGPMTSIFLNCILPEDGLIMRENDVLGDKEALPTEEVQVATEEMEMVKTGGGV